MTSISGSIISTTFTYDAPFDRLGNQTSGLGRTIAWTSYNRPASIASGTRTISFLDEFGHQRFKQVTPEGTTLYFDGFGVYAELMISSASNWNEYLTVGNVMVGERFLTVATSAVTLRYFHTDHLGSVSVITDETGTVVERLSYDPWGKRRFANGADDPSGSITSQTTRGFTGEEELSVASLVHLNGRVYDSLIGRMLSADPTVPDPQNAQAWNRYSYVGNDPLAFTDPTGFSWLSNFFHSVGSFFKRILSNPIVRAVVQIALKYFIGAVLSAAIVTGLSGGHLGDILKAAAIAGATAIAFNIVGTMTASVIQQFGTIAGQAFNVASSAGVGCLSSVASGGSCKSGALAAGISAAADPVLPTDLVGGTIAHAIVGGLGSVAGGGKFADGAVTGAFQYMFSPHAGSEAGGSASNQGGNDDPLTAQASNLPGVMNPMVGLVVLMAHILENRIDSLAPMWLDPRNIRFSQRYVGDDVDEIAASMTYEAWKVAKGAVDVVRMQDGGLTTVDNTRLFAAKQTGTALYASVHMFSDPIQPWQIGRLSNDFGVPATWGDAVRLRIMNQGAAFRNAYPLGSPFIGTR